MEITEKIQTTINSLIKNAEENVISSDDMRQIRNMEQPHVRDRNGFSGRIGKIKCVFSIEHHPKADGSGTAPCRHLALSAPGKLWPSKEDAEQLMAEFGFRGTVENCGISTETSPSQTVNIVQPVDEI